MGLFDSIFGIDITGDGKADMLDDAIILGALEEDETRRVANKRRDDDWTDEDDGPAGGNYASGAIDDLLGF